MSNEKNPERQSLRDTAQDKRQKANWLDKIPQKQIGAVVLSLAIGGILLTTFFEQEATAISSGISDVIPTVGIDDNAEPEVVEVISKSVGDEYYSELEERLENILGKIAGAGEVKVMVTFESSSEKILAENINSSWSSSNETDSAGGTRVVAEEDIVTTILMIDGNIPYIIREDMPAVEGVLVVAEGGDMVGTKNAIIEAVSSLLGVPVHKVSVFKMESK